MSATAGTVVASLNNVGAFGYATSGLEAASANTIAFVSKSLFNGSTPVVRSSRRWAPVSSMFPICDN